MPQTRFIKTSKKYIRDQFETTRKQIKHVVSAIINGKYADSILQAAASVFFDEWPLALG
jgi:hypothetical protein